ncbi:MAG: Fic family protein [Chloroflexi bacterium]|nr:Fic family protein [Chloroflexota bacterium]
MGTHDFIQFPPEVEPMLPRTWLLLGQIQATIKALATMPMLPKDAYELNGTYLAKGIHGTTAIEGNLLSEDQVFQLLQGNAPLENEDHLQIKQVDSMIAAYTAVALDAVPGESPAYSVDLLNHYHGLVLDGLETDEARAGQLRMHNVTVGRYLAPPPDDCELLLAQYCDWLNTEEPVSKWFTSYELALKIMKAIVAHVYFAWIHPYADGNGRMARLIEHALLLRAGIPASASHVFCYCYSQSRERYYMELQDTHGDIIDGAYRKTMLGKFVMYALDQAMEELESQLRWIRIRQTQALWRERIRRHFPVQLTVPQQRRLQLAIDLTDRCVGKPIDFLDIWDLLDIIPAGEFEYSINMLDRDLSALVKMGILTQGYDGFQPNLDIMRGLFGNRGMYPD